MFANTPAALLALIVVTLSRRSHAAAPPSPSPAASFVSSGYFPPIEGGGSQFTDAGVTYPAGLGEPLNVVISNASDSTVFTEQGFKAYMQSINFSPECLGQHLGDPQMANLGDGNGYKNESAVLRFNYGDPNFGTCQETIKGGNHLRYWKQNGPSANTGAIFMAVSVEKNLTYGHDIEPNGYDLGRNWLVGNATGRFTNALGFNFSTNADVVSGLLPNGTMNVNHGLSIDGNIAVLTVKSLTVPSYVAKSDSVVVRASVPFVGLAVSALAFISML